MLVTWNGEDAPALSGYSAASADTDRCLGNVFLGGSPTPTPKTVATPHRYVNYDRSRNLLEFGADHFGLKSLFFWVDCGTLHLSSSMDELLRLFRRRKINPSIPRDSLMEQLIFRYNTGERTLVKGIRRAEPGYLYRCDGNLQFSRECSWDSDFRGDYLKATDDEIVEEIDGRFASVIRDYRIDDPGSIAVALTGGIDSSYMQAHLTDVYGDALFSFSMQYREDGDVYDETGYALSASSSLGTRHTIYTMTRDDFFRSIPEAIVAAQYPLDQVHNTQNFWTQRQLPPQKRFVFSGFGADASFGSGIGKFWLSLKLSPYRGIAGPFLRLLGALGGETRRQQSRRLTGYWGKIERVDDAIAFLPELDSPVDFTLVKEMFTAKEIEEIWSPKLMLIRSKRLRSIADMIFALKLYSLSATLSSQNRAGQAIGREVCFPFCDRRIMEYTKDVSPEQKHRHWGLTTKHLLKKAALRRVPEFIINRPKRSGELPIKAWMRQGLFDEFLRDHEHADLGIDYEKLKRCSLQPGKYNDFMLWSYVNTVLWKELYLKQFGTVEVAAA